MKKALKNILKFSVFGYYEALRDKRQYKLKIKSQKQIIAHYLKNNKIKKLHIGCGSNVYKGWLNTDLNSNQTIAFLDAGLVFPLNNNTFTYIYSEHLFEHLTVSQQLNMLNEGYRVLKKGGVMRIATPSLDFLFNIYKNSNSLENSTYVAWAVGKSPYLKVVKNNISDQSKQYCYVINNFFKAWGHEMIHNYESLKALALQCGYRSVQPCQVGKSTFTDLNGIEKHGTIIPNDMNVLETMVLEITK